jgi:hypothetical protein
MKHMLTGPSLISAGALLALAVGCASTTPTANEENMLIAEGFKTITPKTTAEQQKLQALPSGHLAQIIEDGETFYVFPDAANNRAFVGEPDQYQALVKLPPLPASGRRTAGDEPGLRGPFARLGYLERLARYLRPPATGRAAARAAGLLRLLGRLLRT